MSQTMPKFTVNEGELAEVAFRNESFAKYQEPQVIRERTLSHTQIVEILESLSTGDRLLHEKKVH